MGVFPELRVDEVDVGGFWGGGGGFEGGADCTIIKFCQFTTQCQSKLTVVGASKFGVQPQL